MQTIFETPFEGTDLKLEMPVVDCWEELIGMIPESPVESPKQTKIDVSMELFEQTVTRVHPRKEQMKKEQMKKEQAKRTMTLDEYHKDCERKQSELRAAREEGRMSEAAKKANRNRIAKQRARARKNEGWEPVGKLEAPRAEVVVPREWSRAMYVPTQGKKDRNTTLILKSLPYDGVTEKDLKDFFKKYAGPVKFVNVLMKDDGKCKGIAFVRFETKEGSDRGLTLNNFCYDGRKVHIEYAQDRR